MPNSFCAAGGYPMPQCVINDALHTAQELLGDLFGGNLGQPDSGETFEACSGCRSAPKANGGTGVPKDRSCGCTAAKAGKCSRESSTTPIPPDQKSSKDHSSGDKKTAEHASTVTADKKGDQKQNSEAAAEAENNSGDRHDGGSAAPRNPTWTHSLCLPGFAPNEIHLKVKDGKVHVHARHEESRGPGTCLSRLEMLQTVPLPKNVEQKKLACFLQPDGTMLLCAPLATEFCSSDNEANRTEDLKSDGSKGASENDAEGSEMEGSEDSENKADNMEVLEDEVTRMESLESKAENAKALEDKSSRIEALDNKGESVKALEDKADQMEALTFLSGKQKAEASDSQHHSAVLADTNINKNDDTLAEERKSESPLAEATEIHIKPLKQLAGETLGEESRQSTKEGTDSNKCTSKILEPEDQEKEDPEPSYPIIQEPEDDSSDSEEKEDEEQTYIRKSSTSTGDGDFEVISEGFVHVSTDFDDMMLPPGDTVVNEEQSRNHTTDKTGTSPIDTDPTPPIKRSSDTPGEANDLGNVECLDSLDSEGTESTPSEHAKESLGGQDYHSGNTGEQGGAFHVSLPLVGFSPGDIYVKLAGHTLSIEAQRQSWLAEASYTEDVQRRLELPSHLDMSTIKCVYNNDGCLVITASPRGDSRQVPVEFVSQ